MQSAATAVCARLDSPEMDASAQVNTLDAPDDNPHRPLNCIRLEPLLDTMDFPKYNSKHHWNS